MNMSQRVNDLIFVSEHLIQLLRKENAALMIQDNATVEALLDEKDALCRAFEQRALVLGKYSDELQAEEVEQDRVELVRDMGSQINALIEENANLLRAAIEANSYVMSLVAQAVKETQSSAGTYGASGDVMQKTLKSPSDVAISFDQTL